MPHLKLTWRGPLEIVVARDLTLQEATRYADLLEEQSNVIDVCMYSLKPDDPQWVNLITATVRDTPEIRLDDRPTQVEAEVVGLLAADAIVAGPFLDDGEHAELIRQIESDLTHL